MPNTMLEDLILKETVLALERFRVWNLIRPYCEKEGMIENKVLNSKLISKTAFVKYITFL